MSAFTRMGLLVISIAVLGGALAWAGWTRTISQATPADQDKQTWVMAAPGVASDIVTDRIRVKQKVVERLLAGELSLVEAAAWFRFVNDHPPDCRCDFRRAMPGRSDGEKACRQVLAWAELDLKAGMPESQVELVRCRLEGELASLLAEGDEIELPW
jgi:hypothetical protein